MLLLCSNGNDCHLTGAGGAAAVRVVDTAVRVKVKIDFPSLGVSKSIFFKNWNINLILLLESFPMLFTDFKNSSYIKSYEQKTAKF